MKTVVGWVAVALIALFLGIQLVPYGRAHTNPARRAEPPWNAPQTRQLAVRACFDCHSNETVWPWYSNIAPVSWIVQRDVDEGRKKLNYSEWGQDQKEAKESAEAVQKGEMPPWYYPWANLSRAEREALIQGLQTTFGGKATNKKGRRDR